jgi:hypothetical protein
MAPEMFPGDRESDTQSVDVSAYAVLLYAPFCHDSKKMVGGQGAVVESPASLMKRTEKVRRFRKAPGIRDRYWRLIAVTWSHNPLERGDFSEVVSCLVAHPDDFILHGWPPCWIPFVR